MRLKDLIKEQLTRRTVPVLFCSGMIMIGIVSCSNSTQQVQQTKKSAFHLPDIPANITDPELRAEYLSIHYWDNYDFTDTTQIQYPEITEQAISDFIAILSHVGEPLQKGAIYEMLYRAENKKCLFMLFSELLEKYLYDPNSPLRNEEYYLHVLRYINASGILNEVEKSQFTYQLKAVLKNRKGTIATDFIYTLSNGTKKQMYGIKVKYLLVFFYNPGCEACREVKTALSASTLVSKLLKENKLKILAIYPDKNLNEWHSYQSQIPSTWINAYDEEHTIVSKGLYDLRAIPSLYLLDQNKNVLIKDGTVKQVEEILTTMVRY